MWSFAAGTLAITSGSKMWGVIAAVVLSLATNIYHTLAASPNDAPSQKPMDGIGNP